MVVEQVAAKLVQARSLNLVGRRQNAERHPRQGVVEPGFQELIIKAGDDLPAHELVQVKGERALPVLELFGGRAGSGAVSDDEEADLPPDVGLEIGRASC